LDSRLFSNTRNTSCKINGKQQTAKNFIDDDAAERNLPQPGVHRRNDLALRPSPPRRLPLPLPLVIDLVAGVLQKGQVVSGLRYDARAMLA